MVPLSDAEGQTFAERLVTQGQTAGLQPVGPGVLFADIATRAIETGLKVEVTEHPPL